MVVQFGEQTIDLTPPWPRITLSDLIKQRLGVDLDPTMPVEQARAILDGLGVRWEDDWGSGKLMKQVVDDKIQHEIVNPIFVVDYPQEVSPLARAHRSRPGYVERFELMVAGFELCNAYSEQNDAAAQLAAFEGEARAKAKGDPEAGDIDLDYVRALEYGLPCTGGLGIGIDRLVMLLSGAQNIREVILFPTMKPEPGTGPTPAKATPGIAIGSLRPAPVASDRGGTPTARRTAPGRHADRAPGRAAHPARLGWLRQPRWPDPAAHPGAGAAFTRSPVRHADRPALVPGHRSPDHAAARARSALSRRPVDARQAAGLAAGGGPVQRRRCHEHPQGPAPDLDRLLRGDGRGPGRLSPGLPRVG